MISPGCFYCSNSRGNFEMTADVSVINNINNTSCIWAKSSVWRFVKAAFIENLKSYRSVNTTSTSYSRKLERSFAEIFYFWKSFELAVINVYCTNTMKSVPVVPRSAFLMKVVESISISFKRFLLEICLTAPFWY